MKIIKIITMLSSFVIGEKVLKDREQLQQLINGLD
jgi:hypothetical protein